MWLAGNDCSILVVVDGKNLPEFWVIFSTMAVMRASLMIGCGGLIWGFVVGLMGVDGGGRVVGMWSGVGLVVWMAGRWVDVGWLPLPVLRFS